MRSMLLIFALLGTNISFANQKLPDPKELKELQLKLVKTDSIKKQLKYLKENDSEEKKFQYGIYFGKLLVDHPEYLDKLVKHYEYISERDTLFIALKKANIKNTYYPEENAYKIVDPMTFKKFYDNSVMVLLGEFRYSLDTKYLDKILELEMTLGETYSAKSYIRDVISELDFQYDMNKKPLSDSNSTDSNASSKAQKIDLDELF